MRYSEQLVPQELNGEGQWPGGGQKGHGKSLNAYGVAVLHVEKS